MTRLLRHNTAFTFRIGPFVDVTDGHTAEAGETIGQADIQISKNGAAFAQTSDASPTTTLDTDGWYQCPLTATDTDTLGWLTIQIAESATARHVYEHFMVVSANVYGGVANADSLHMSPLILHVDVSTGSDSNDGADWTTPMLTLGAAIAAIPQKGTILIRNTDAGSVRTLSGNLDLDQPTDKKDITIIGIQISDVAWNIPIIGSGVVKESGDWSLTAAQTFTYEAAATESGIVSVFIIDPHLYANDENTPGEVGLTSQASIGDVESNPGSFYFDDGGNKLYVHVPDSTTAAYFAAGGGIFASTNNDPCRIRYGNKVALRAVNVWGFIDVLYGGEVILDGVNQRFSASAGIRIGWGASVRGENFECSYNVDDGITTKGDSFLSLKNVISHHNGTAVGSDQCLTGHGRSTIYVENFTGYSCGSQVAAFVDQCKVVMKNFVLRDPGTGLSRGLQISDECMGDFQNGYIHGCTTGFVVNDSTGDKDNVSIVLRNVVFDDNTTDISVASGEAEVVLIDCDFAGTPANTTIINSDATRINDEVVDVLKTDTIAQRSQGAPPDAPTFEEAIMYLYQVFRNKTEQTSSLMSMYDDAGSTVICKSDISDNGTTATKAEFISGA